MNRIDLNAIINSVKKMFNIKDKEEFLPNYLNDKINQNNTTVRNIKNNIYNQVKTIIEQIKVSNDLILTLQKQPQPQTQPPLPQPQLPQPVQPVQPVQPIQPVQPRYNLTYDNVNTGYAYLDGYNSTIYDNYNLYNCPPNTIGCSNSIQKVGSGNSIQKVGSGNSIQEASSGNSIQKASSGNSIQEASSGNNKEGGIEDSINKLMTFNKDYIKTVLSSLDDSIYNMHQNIFDLEGKNDSQVEINTYHLEMLIYTQFLFKKLEKNISNPKELNAMFINILKKINDDLYKN
jgi:hypothetical protein